MRSVGEDPRHVVELWRRVRSHKTLDHVKRLAQRKADENEKIGIVRIGKIQSILSSKLRWRVRSHKTLDHVKRLAQRKAEENEEIGIVRLGKIQLILSSKL